MADLTARTAFAGLLPLSIGRVTLTEPTPEVITSVAPLKGQAATVSASLERQTGAAFPDPNRFTEAGPNRIIWSGLGQAFALGPALDPIEGAAMTDQTDAWGGLVLEGADARAALARHMPIDLRPEVFAVGHAARTLLGHMNCLIFRTGPDRYECLVFRSMAATAVHELERAMRMVAARAAV